jgi:hypothetical protein
VWSPAPWGAWCGWGRGSLAEAEDELRVVGHLVRRPRRVEGQLELDLLDSGHLHRDAVDVLRDERAGRAPHRGQAVDHLRLVALDLDLVNEPEVDDVHPELGILDLAERLEYVVAAGHSRQRIERSPSKSRDPFVTKPKPVTVTGFRAAGTGTFAWA